MRDYLELTKPRITILILICTGVGYWFGRGGSFDLAILIHALLKMRQKLAWFADLSKRFVSFINCCNVETFLKMGQVYQDLVGTERRFVPGMCKILKVNLKLIEWYDQAKSYRRASADRRIEGKRLHR